MRPFVGFKRKAVVVLPTDKVFRERIEKRTKEEGKEVPETAVLEMKGSCPTGIQYLSSFTSPPPQGGCRKYCYAYFSLLIV